MGETVVSVFFLTPLFPGTECIASARTALSPPAAFPRVQGMSLSALKWLFNRLLLSSGKLIASPGASMPMVVWYEGQAGCRRRGYRAHPAVLEWPLCHQLEEGTPCWPCLEVRDAGLTLG